MDFAFLLFDRLQKIKQIAEEEDLESRGYIAFSGGKDSCVLSRLVDMALPFNQIPRVYTNTGVDYKEMVSFVRRRMEKDPRIVEIQNSRPVREILKEEGFPFKSKEHSKKYRLFWQGSKADSVLRYWRSNGCDSKSFCAPDALLYQRESPLPFKVSEFCCARLKKDPAHDWARANGREVVITGIRASEGGQRANVRSCLAFAHGKLASFSPLIPCDDDFIAEFIEREKIELCKLYSPPFNFKRTGCKGCPFNLHLQENLDTLEKFFPAERKQCELLFGEVYAEYRRLHYRLS